MPDVCEVSMVFNIYKRGQGKYTRLCSAFAVALIAGLGCLQLFNRLEAASWGSRKTAMWIATMVPAGLFALLALLIFWLVNKPSIADFMIAAEGEMKKVSWSSKQEITVSTIIVVVVIVIMATLLGTTDIAFKVFFDWLI
ncbi:MAG: preprotein translocase subunit SecE [Planctomycetota bacterium]